MVHAPLSSFVFELSGMLFVTAGRKRGRSQNTIANRTAAKPPIVTAIAGSTRRTIAPTATPRATAKIAYAIGTMPWMSKWPGTKRLSIAFSGERHQLTRIVSTPDHTTAAAKTHARFTLNHFRRVTPCVQAKFWVPSSNSLARSGAPQKRPRSTGTIKERSTRSMMG